MHDVLEGVCCYELKLILCELIYTKKYFDLNLLNDRIRSFNYSPIERGSKPVVINVSHLKSADGTIKQSTSEMWCLMTNLSIMLGDKIPMGDPVWELLLSALDIMNIVFSVAITEGATYCLQSIIEEHLQYFKEVFPPERLRSKHHYLVHYSRCIRLVGSLMRFWCMRFEAKHNFFMRLTHCL